MAGNVDFYRFCMVCFSRNAVLALFQAKTSFLCSQGVMPDNY
ncbi:MAG: hypothetical protein V7711_16835 [Pseudomonadales bacterium]